jgi:hypothetical protein
MAFMHHPLYSSGTIGNTPTMQPLWQALYDYDADVVLAGHDHNYERFNPQTPAGVYDPARGIVEFVVGTGGRNTSSLGTTKANSVKRSRDAYGVLKMTLRPTGYDWQFVPIPGYSLIDSGSASCHGGSASSSVLALSVSEPTDSNPSVLVAVGELPRSLVLAIIAGFGLVTGRSVRRIERNRRRLAFEFRHMAISLRSLASEGRLLQRRH